MGNFKRAINLYKRPIPLSFGITMVSNLTTSMMLDNSHFNLVKQTSLYTAIIISKSLFFGIFWPMIPVFIYFYPSNYSILGYTISNQVWVEAKK